MNQNPGGEHQITDDTGKQDSLRKWAGIVYLLQILSFAFGGITLVVGAIINYLKRPDVQGSWLESHFNYQITTFWWTLGLAICGGLTITWVFGYILLLLAFIYLIYRVFRGWSRWNVGQPIDESEL